MTSQNPNSYLETQVLTSPPQKLQLLLIEAAIRFAKKAQSLREEGDEKGACEALGRAQKIVSEIIGGLNQDVDPQLVGQIASIYIFIGQSLLQANLPENTQALADAIRILEEERTTWRMVCEKLAAEGSDQNEAASLKQQGDAQKTPSIDSVELSATAGSSYTDISGPSELSGPTKLPTESISADLPTSGFSLDA